MKRMIRYGMKPVRYRIVVINVLLALALTLLVDAPLGIVAVDHQHAAAHAVMQQAGGKHREGRLADAAFLAADRNEMRSFCHCIVV